MCQARPTDRPGRPVSCLGLCASCMRLCSFPAFGLRFARANVSMSVSVERSAPAPAIVRTSHAGTGAWAMLCPTARCCFIQGVSVIPVCVMPSGRRMRSATSSS